MLGEIEFYYPECGRLTCVEHSGRLATGIS